MNKKTKKTIEEVVEQTIKQPVVDEEKDKKYLSKEDFLELELLRERVKTCDFRLNDLKNQKAVKEQKVKEAVDMLYRARNDEIFIAEAVQKTLREHSVEKQKVTAFLMSLVDKYGLPQAYKEGKTFYYNDESLEIILD